MCYAQNVDIPKAVIFDLDETLAPSFQGLDESMARRLAAVIDRLPTALMTGAGYDRIERDVLLRLPSCNLAHFSLFPNSSAQCFLYKDGAWVEEYSHLLTEDERRRIIDALLNAIAVLPELAHVEAYGERIIDRGAQIAFTAVGVDAPQEVKLAWDPTTEKRAAVAQYLRSIVPGFNILIGGSSTIDITKLNTNKATGVRWYATYLNVQPSEMLYIGDALFPGGNDEVVIETGIRTIEVRNPGHTATIIDDLLAAD